MPKQWRRRWWWLGRRDAADDRLRADQHFDCDDDQADREHVRRFDLYHRLGCDRWRDRKFHPRIRHRLELRDRDYGVDRRLQPHRAVRRSKERGRRCIRRSCWAGRLRRDLGRDPVQRLDPIYAKLDDALAACRRRRHELELRGDLPRDRHGGRRRISLYCSVLHDQRARWSRCGSIPTAR